MITVIASITYGVAKELAFIIKPLVGQSPHHLKNTKHFIQQLQGNKLEPGEVITSFDVKALFTSVPVHPAIQMVKQGYSKTPPFHKEPACPYHKSSPYWSSASLTNTYFLFQGKYYEQVHGAAMGSPISLLIANIFMEELKEVKTLSSIPHPLPLAKVCWWHLCHQQGRTQSGSTSAHQQQGPTYPVHSGTNTTRLTTIPWHSCHHRTRQHLQHHSLQETHPHGPISTLDNNHHIPAKQSVYTTLAHRAKIISSTQDKLDRELQHIRTALQHCQLPDWALNQWHQKFTNPIQPTNNNNINNNTNPPTKKRTLP